jgi:hypothetical protein
LYHKSRGREREKKETLDAREQRRSVSVVFVCQTLPVQLLLRAEARKGWMWSRGKVPKGTPWLLLLLSLLTGGEEPATPSSTAA